MPFITAGDPSLKATVPVLHALVDAGADVSNSACRSPTRWPTARSSSAVPSARWRAASGLSLVLDVRAPLPTDRCATPVVLMGYLNPIEIRGAGRFAADAVDAGVDGVLLVDLPPEEARRVRRAAFAQHGFALILLAAPTTTDARLALLCDAAQGYLYYVSFAGVTGADRLDAGAAGDRLRAIRARSDVPVVARFRHQGCRHRPPRWRGKPTASWWAARWSPRIAQATDEADAAARAGGFLRRCEPRSTQRREGLR